MNQWTTLSLNNTWEFPWGWIRNQRKKKPPKETSPNLQPVSISEKKNLFLFNFFYKISLSQFKMHYFLWHVERLFILLGLLKKSGLNPTRNYHLDWGNWLWRLFIWHRSFMHLRETKVLCRVNGKSSRVSPLRQMESSSPLNGVLAPVWSRNWDKSRCCNTVRLLQAAIQFLNTVVGSTR